MTSQRVLTNPSRVPAGFVDVGEGRYEYRLSDYQEECLRYDLLRYYTWEASGRKFDPWHSGAGQGQRYDQPRVVKGPPVGGYGPGTASPPEHDAALLRMAEAYPKLSDHEQLVLRLHTEKDLTHGQIAAILSPSGQVTDDEVGDLLRRVKVRLRWRLV